MIGKTISHYKILEKLGEGGMGVVYKAEDTKLKRAVALKFLPPELTRDSEAKERFVREAQAASALDHPSIGTIYEIDETEERQLFIAMACYEGETLKQKIEKGPLKIEEATEFAIQVAEGLAKAHEQGIIHRDIKPANAMVTRENRVKILDFGLAKFRFAESQFTKAGTMLGTVAYMSPEQLLGEKVDHRTDIWALGVLIHEMVTGQLPFKGDYEQAVTYSIMNEEPELMTGLRTGVPMYLELIVNKCLSKSPNERYQHIDEIPVDLRALESGPISASTSMKKTTASSSIPRPKRWQRLLPWSIAGLMMVMAAFFTVQGVMPPTPGAPRSLMRFVIDLPAEQRFVGPASVAISPDGTRLVYTAAQAGGQPQLYLRTLEQLEARPIPGTEGGVSPFFSPDGQWIGFFAEGAFMKVPVTSGVPLKICDAPSLAINFAADWDGNDKIIFPVGHASGLARIPATGGTPETLTTPDFDQGEVAHFLPHVLPNGEGFLFTVWTVEGARVSMLSFETGERRLILGEMAAAAQYIPTGHLLFMQSGGLMAAPFDLERLEPTGTPIPLPERVSASLTETAFSISHTGTLVYLPSHPAKNSLMWVDRTGRAVPVMAEQGRYRHPRLSPNGKKIALTATSVGRGQDIVVYDLERDTRTRLTVDGSVNNYAVWTPDGARITFNSTRAEQGLYWKLADGSGKAEKLLARSYPQHPCDWSPDGKTLAYTEMNPATGTDIWTLSLDNKRTATPLIATSFQEHSPRFSPDGRWLTYVADETGHDEVYVVRYPDLGAKWLISTGGGKEPVWSADGQELFYRNQDQMMTVSIQTEPVFRAGKPQRLFKGQWAASAMSTPHYDVSSDRQRFIMIRSGEGSQPRQLHVVVNWFEELKRHTSGAK